MRQILPSDWLPEWVRWAYLALLGLPALFLCLKKSCVVQTSIPVVCNFWLIWAMELQKGAEDCQNKEKVNDCHEVIMLQKPKNTKLKNKMKISKSFLILIKVKPHSFFLFFWFFWTWTKSWCIKMQKLDLASVQPSWSHAWWIMCISFTSLLLSELLIHILFTLCKCMCTVLKIFLIFWFY